jgi:hypothetical protein
MPASSKASDVLQTIRFLASADDSGDQREVRSSA